MADPISEKIAVIVRSRVAAISTGAGYETTVSGAIRPRRIPTDRPKDYQVVVTQGDKVHNVTQSHAGNPPAKAWDFPFMINAILLPQKTNTKSADTLKNIFEADITKSLTSVASWHTFGGNAITATIDAVTDYTSTDGGEAGFQVVLTVLFRVSEFDPYTLRT